MENCILQQPHLRMRIFSTKQHVGDPFLCLRRRPMLMKVKASSSSSSAGHQCEFSSTLNAPLEPRSHVGEFLSGVLQNHRRLFHVVATEELRQLSDDRDSAVARMILSRRSDEALLHRRIAQLKEDECQIAIQDVMYILILYKFSEIGVPMAPKLSSCLYNGRLEVLPYKEWQLESIHSMEVLDIVREHINMLTGLKTNSSVRECWATTRTRQSWLARVYVASLLYGYFLKSVSIRYHLERCLYVSNHHDLHHIGHHRLGLPRRGSRGTIFKKSDHHWQDLIRKEEEGIGDLKCYIKGFHSVTLLERINLRSKEALHLVENHSRALFGSGLDQHDEGDVVLTSFSTMRRLLLEAVAFGSFLWDTEDYVNKVCRLKDRE